MSDTSKPPRAGLSALPLRPGTRASHKAAMLRRLSRELPELTTRDDSDASIALIDAWAGVLDVLGFYQERIGNEAYLGTATERLSVRELVRAIGYELSPGLAAETSLAFTVQDSRSAPVVNANAKLMAAPTASWIDAGTKVQSVPGPNETAQTFETVEPIEARLEWNAIQPLHQVPQEFGPELLQLYFTGIATGLQRGDPLLLVGDERRLDPRSEQWDLRHVSALELDPAGAWTRVTLDVKPGWSDPSGSGSATVAPALRNVRVYTFRLRAALFGNNAPDWLAMPDDTVKRGYLAQVLGDCVVRARTGRAANWVGYGSNVRFIDISVHTAQAKFSDTPLYFTSLAGKSAHSFAAGLASVYVADKDSFALRLTSDNVTLSSDYANQHHWTLQWLGVEPGRQCGATVARATEWQQDQAGPGVLFVDVDTRASGFGSTPLYFTSLGGENHSQTQGITTIHHPTAQGFRVCVHHPYSGDTPAMVNSIGWRVNWFAVEPGLRSGSTDPHDWRALSDGSGIYVDVDTSAARFTSTPLYFTSLAVVDDEPLFVKGANAIYEPTPRGFRVCLHPIGPALTPARATAGGWRLQWVGVEPNAFQDDWPAPLYCIRTAAQRQIDLDAAYPQVVADSWLALSQPGSGRSFVRLYRVEGVDSGSRRDFALSTKTTHVRLDSDRNLAGFGLRETAVLAQSVELAVAGAPVRGALSGDRITVEGTLDGLPAGRRLAVSGRLMRTAADGSWTPALATDPVVSEVVALQRLDDDGAGHTVMALNRSLQNAYDPATVTICANVARATHGETRRQVLGCADARQPNQQFALKQGPLTYVSSQTPGGASSLQVQVNDIVWDAVPSLYGHTPRDRVYHTRLTEEGTAVVEFGDGVSGARPPSGSGNVVATYRTGSGQAGNVKAGQLSQLMTRPLGVQEAINPVPSAGGQDPESLAGARRNAPTRVLAFERVVSLEDYADFARAFGGIGKACAGARWNGEHSAVRLTLCGPAGGAVSAETLDNLRAALRSASCLGQVVEPEVRNPARFGVFPTLVVDSHYDAAKVAVAALDSLKRAFSFDNREFGQPVYPSHVEAALQAAEGVLGVDLDAPAETLPGYLANGQPLLWILNPEICEIKTTREAS